MEIATIGSECTEIPIDWLEKCFLAHRKESGYIPKVSDLLRLWRGSLRVEAHDQKMLQAPKAGSGHDCRFCMVVYQRLETYQGKAGNSSILLHDELELVKNPPLMGEVRCFLTGLASLSKNQYEIILEHWGEKRNPYGMTSMDIRRGVDTIKLGREWTK